MPKKMRKPRVMQAARMHAMGLGQHFGEGGQTSNPAPDSGRAPKTLRISTQHLKMRRKP